MANVDDTIAIRSPARPQFGINAMLWATFVIALALGYLRQFNSPNLFASAAIVLVTAAVIGVLIGWPVKRIGDTTYWSVVITTAAFLSVSGDAARQRSSVMPGLP